MAKMKKGILFTVGLAFYCAILLTLAAMFLEHSKEMTSAGNEMAALERVSSTFLGLEKSARDVFEKTSGIGISIDGGTVVFSETLPNPLALEYRTASGGLESFADRYGNRSDVSVDMDLSDSRSNMSIWMEPQEILVTHGPYGSGKLTVSPNQINFESYTIQLKVPEDVSCASNLVAGDDFQVQISVSGILETSCSGGWIVNASASSTYSVNNGSVTINITNGSAVIESSVVGVELEFAIGLEDFAGKEPELYLTDTITAASARPEAVKESRIRLL